MRKTLKIIIMIIIMIILFDFEIQTDHLILARRPDLVLNNNNNKKEKKKKEKKRMSRFCWNHRAKIKKKKKDRQILGHSQRTKNPWNMRVAVIPIVVGGLGTVPKGLERGLRLLEIVERIETIQTIALLKSAWILRKVLETWGDL